MVKQFRVSFIIQGTSLGGDAHLTKKNLIEALTKEDGISCYENRSTNYVIKSLTIE